MLTGHYILRNLVSYIRLIKHCCSNIFLINCICFGEPLWAAFFELLLNRPDDYVPPACSSTHDKAQGLRLSGMEALAQIAFLLFFPKSCVILTVKGSEFLRKTSHPTISPCFSYLLPRARNGISKVLSFWEKGCLGERREPTTNSTLIYSVTSRIRVHAT